MNDEPEKKKKDPIYGASARIDRIGSIFYGVRKPDEVVERILTDYARVGKVPIDILKQRAKKRLGEENAAQS